MNKDIFYTAYLMGGLGNQMFQIAHAISQGIKNGVYVKFKAQAHTPMQAFQPTKYLDNIFDKINFGDFNMENVKIYESKKWDFYEINPPKEFSTLFYGYFQSHKNFYGNDEYIRNIFQPSDQFIKKIYIKYPQLIEQNNVSIHIRRGDYLKISNILPTIDVSYITKCLSSIENYDNLFILSDDKDWVAKNIKLDNMIIVDELEDYEELWLISLCKTNIMSNSTFSWWGSFLNKNENSKIYCPSIWFGPNGEKNYNDIFYNNWNKINVNYLDGKLVV
jgi:hypothetical protein